MPKEGRTVPRKLGRSVFFWKLWGSYAALTLVAAAMIAWLINRYFSAEADKALRSKLSTIAELGASLAAASPEELWSGRLQARLEEVTEKTETSADVVLASGKVMMAANAGVALPGEALELEEFRDAHITGSGEKVRIGDDGEEFVYVVKPIVIQSENIGYVRVGSSTEMQLAQSRLLNERVAAGASGAAILSLLVGVLLSRGVMRPLSRIESACREIEKGNLKVRIDLVREDEFGLVARSVNRMADFLEAQLRELEQQRNRLELLLKLLRDSVVALDSSGKVMFLNASAESLFRISESEAKGKFYREVCGIGVIADLIQEAIDKERELSSEASWSENEAQRHASVYLAPLRVDDSIDSGNLVVIRDITESRRFEELRRDFSSNVSHELKTPVTAIAALLDALEEGAGSDEKMREEYLSRIGVQNDRMMRLIGELLALSRLEAGSDILELRKMDLRRVAAVARETFGTMASLRGIAFSADCSREELPVRGDRRALEVVVNSLVDNAFKHTAEDGRIKLSIERFGNRGCIIVRDTGRGIAPRHMDRIFERFYRIDTSRSRDRGGTGLGLAIVKHIAAAHDGIVSVESEEGVGSEFRVSIPLAGV